jgi:large subunit ribosomal protein L11
MAWKKITKQFTLHMVAAKATPAPPVWPILWQHWINIWQFVKEFNDKTRELSTKFWWLDIKVPVNISVYVDRSYNMDILPPLTSNLILWKANQKKWSSEANKNKIWKITKNDIEEIIDIKISVMNTKNRDSIAKSIIGTAKSLWVEVE